MRLIRNSCFAVAALLIASSAFVFAQAPTPAPGQAAPAPGGAPAARRGSVHRRSRQPHSRWFTRGHRRRHQSTGMDGKD